jgi:hypothetical protein
MKPDIPHKDVLEGFAEMLYKIGHRMHQNRAANVLFIAFALLWTNAFADAPNNPYAFVVERNPFGLKQPPPPPPVTPPQPTVPLPKVVLTGIVTRLLGSAPRVLLEVTEQEAGKPANVKKPIMRQGEKDGMIEILSIDVANNQVTIRNGTTETNLTFEVAKATGPAPSLPSIPGLTPPAAGSAIPNASASNTGSPTIVTPAGMSTSGRAGTGVGVFGGTTPATGAPSGYPIVASGSSPTYAGLGSANLGGVSTYGSASTATRDLRVQTPQLPQTMSTPESHFRMQQATDRITRPGLPPPPPPPPPPGMQFQNVGGR